MTSSPSAPTDDAIERQERLDQKRKQVEAERRRGLLPGGPVASMHTPGWEQRHWTSRLLHWVGDVAGHSITGTVAVVLVVGWAIVGALCEFAPWWHAVLYSVTGSVTFVMVFVIQHAQQRQTAGTQRKLDELIRSSAPADNGLIAVEEAAEEHLQALTHLNLADRTRAGGIDLE